MSEAPAGRNWQTEVYARPEVRAITDAIAKRSQEASARVLEEREATRSLQAVRQAEAEASAVDPRQMLRQAIANRQLADERLAEARAAAARAERYQGDIGDELAKLEADERAELEALSQRLRAGESESVSARTRPPTSRTVIEQQVATAERAFETLTGELEAAERAAQAAATRVQAAALGVVFTEASSRAAEFKGALDQCRDIREDLRALGSLRIENVVMPAAIAAVLRTALPNDGAPFNLPPAVLAAVAAERTRRWANFLARLAQDPEAEFEEEAKAAAA